MIELKQFTAACVILSCALAGQVHARDVNAAKSGNATVGQATDAQPKGGKTANSKKDQSGGSDANAARKGVSCQRDIPYKGEDGKMHLCK